MSVLYATATSGTSTGAVNTMHDSLTPLAGMVPMFNLLAGCIWPGGVGAGLYGFLVVAIIAVFVAGLMVGRTPGISRQEDRGARNEIRDAGGAASIRLSVLGFYRRVGAAADGARQSRQQRPARPLRNHLCSSPRPTPTTARRSPGSTAIRSGSTRRCGLAMLLGRFAYVVPVLAMAGSLAAKKKVPASAGTFPTDGPLFVGLLGRRDRHSLPAAIFPGPLARAGRRALPDAQRQDLLIGDRSPWLRKQSRRACSTARSSPPRRSTPCASSTRELWRRTRSSSSPRWCR